ncbi:MAG: S-methyl-5-thioribose-1-phosphate isomerase, partial [Lachnospiraceae bacterium]|nr:S-methyl-5-thioribose-1-phosphate isomerase [Lachnospiraceae bacterium]
MDIDTVTLDEENKALVIIDQTKLPGTIELISLTEAKEIWDAIYLLQVRGAPAIGVAAAIGMYVLAARYDTTDVNEFYKMFKRDKEYLDS